LRVTLGAIVILFSPLYLLSLARLLHMPKVKVDATLGNLHFILHIPKNPSRPTRLHHPGSDFLLEQQRCGDPHILVDEKLFVA
jgi:hypothetical protein